MLCSINDKMEKFLVKDVFLYQTCFTISNSIFNGVKKEYLFLCYGVFDSNVVNVCV